MLDAIKRWLTGQGEAPGTVAGEPGATNEERLRVAACVLLLELAHSDDEFSDDERRHIEEALSRHFDLPAESARELMELAETHRRDTIDLHRFTSFIVDQYDEGQRQVLAEIMWRIVYADGELSRHEDYLLGKLARLLDLRPGYLAAAQRRVKPEGGG